VVERFRGTATITAAEVSADLLSHWAVVVASGLARAAATPAGAGTGSFGAPETAGRAAMDYSGAH